MSDTENIWVRLKDESSIHQIICQIMGYSYEYSYNNEVHAFPQKVIRSFSDPVTVLQALCPEIRMIESVHYRYMPSGHSASNKERLIFFNSVEAAVAFKLRHGEHLRDQHA